MEKVNFLRKKHLRFIYRDFKIDFFKKSLKITFDFQITPDIFFRPEISIKNIKQKQIKRVGERVLNNLVFHFGLIEMLSYWKATCSPEIIAKPGKLNKEQIKWWQRVIKSGMGQFFYENKINYQKPNFLKIKTKKGSSLPLEIYRKKLLPDHILVPIGGGKDSIVTFELLKNWLKKENIQCFSLNPGPAAKKIMKIGGGNPIIVQRKIDPQLLKLNQKGYLNGHTPFSAYLAFLSVLLSVLANIKYIAFANERSANEGNVKYFGKTVNHQWSKSFDFEKKFRFYSKRYLAKNIEYFSFLRPLYELQIAKIFSKYPEYFPIFLSCNESFKRKPLTLKRWCGKCPKCLFVFTLLYPFIEEKRLMKIFGKNLFEDKKLLPLMRQLIEKKQPKPFECVGTKKENLAAFYLSWKKSRELTPGKLPFLLEYLEENVLSKYPNLPGKINQLLNSWDKNNFLRKKFEKILKNEIKRTI